MEDEPAPRTSRMETPRIERDIIVVVGKSGMGKTRWTREYLKSQHRIIIMDTQGEHEGLDFTADMDGMIDHIQEYRVFRVRTESVEDFPMVCAIAYAARRNVLVVEESQRVLPASRKDVPPSFADVIYRGRHRRTSLVLISQRASTINIAARSQWTRLIIFNQTEPSDVGWLLDTTGFNLDPANLKQSNYYDVTPGDFQQKSLSNRGGIDFRKSDDTIDEDSDDANDPSQDREDGDPEWESNTS